MFDSPYEIIRFINLDAAFLALALNVAKGWRQHFFKNMRLDGAIGYLALLAWCLGYFIAGWIAVFNEVEAGIWSVIMIMPVGWTLIAGAMGWSRNEPASREPIGRVISAELTEEGLRMEGIVFSDDVWNKMRADVEGMSIYKKDEEEK